MIAATDTGLVPMRVSKAVGLKDGDDFPSSWCWMSWTGTGIW
jgi:hypothetical protein